MQYSVCQERELDEDGKDIFQNPELFDNILFKPKCQSTPQKYCSSPAIVINDDFCQDVEVAEIESYFARNLTPEGNVKYRNYKVLALNDASIRVYSPSGDIHTTPKKCKVMPKFDIIDDLNFHREKLLELITDNTKQSAMLREIIKPSCSTHRKTIEALKRANPSRLDDYISFLSSVSPYSPSPSFSVFSDDTNLPEALTPASSPEASFSAARRGLLHKSQSIEEKRGARKLHRQVSVPHDGINRVHMCLSDELSQAERYSRCNRPLSSLSGRMTPLESKKSILRSFVQRNMILESSNRDRLAKLALAVEDDEDGDSSCCDVNVTNRSLENKIGIMLDETRELKESLFEIQYELQEDDRIVLSLIGQTKSLYLDLEIVRYLDDLIALLNGDLQQLIGFEQWPFLLQRGKLHKNLII